MPNYLSRFLVCINGVDRNKYKSPHTAAHRMNAGVGLKQPKLFGILSSADVWYCVEYKRGAHPPFASSRPYRLEEIVRADSVEYSDLELLVNTVYAFILTSWLELPRL
jgi:hypothetical protein